MTRAIKASFLNIALLLICQISFGQLKSDLQCNFRLKHTIETISDPSEMIGLFVKGTPSKAIEFTETHSGSYRSSIKGWQYIRIPASSLEDLVNSKDFKGIDFAPYKGETACRYYARQQQN